MLGQGSNDCIGLDGGNLTEFFFVLQICSIMSDSLFALLQIFNILKNILEFIKFIVSNNPGILKMISFI